MKQFLGTIILLVGTMGWWGFVYPDLCLTPEYCETADKTAVEENGSVKGKRGMKEEILDIQDIEDDEETEKICIKSRLYEYVCQVREKG